MAALAVIALAACGGAGSRPVSVGAESTATTREAAMITVVGAARGKPTTITARASALDGLRTFLARVDRADSRLTQAARLVNGDAVSSGMRIRPITRAAITAIELDDVAQALPAGMPQPLTRKALLVYSELASRRGAFESVVRVQPGPDGIATVAKGTDGMRVIEDCLANGSRANARFRPDVAALRSLASSTSPFPVVPASSRATGEILVRTAYIDGWNRCCDSCGGYVTDRLAPVVWAAKDLPSGEHIDGTIDGVGFEASYRPGSGWRVVVHAG